VAKRLAKLWRTGSIKKTPSNGGFQLKTKPQMHISVFVQLPLSMHKN
jgi:hypothetical protein